MYTCMDMKCTQYREFITLKQKKNEEGRKGEVNSGK